MGRYFNPVDELPKVGRQLIASSRFEELENQLLAGERLVGLYDRGPFKNAPFLDDEENFSNFEQSWQRRKFLSREFYAVPEQEAESHDRPIELSAAVGY